MKPRGILVAIAVMAILTSIPAMSQTLADVGEAPAHSITAGFTQADVVAAFQAGHIKHLRTLGLLVFSTPFNSYDGHGDGPFDPAEGSPSVFGHRPTLQGNGQFLRLNGLDAQACNECHGVVSNATLPPTLGLAGVGTVVASAFPNVKLADFADSSDDRVSYAPGHDPDLPLQYDGVADLDGRFINPPFLYGGGGVELAAKEMTLELQALLDQARNAPAGTTIALDTKGVHFGYVTSLGNGDVELEPEGIGPVEYENVPPEEVLVVRPFGRKGENFSMRDFDRGAMQFHFGIQAEEVVGSGVDEDGDGHVNEVTIAEMSMLHIFDVTNPRPRFERLNADEQIGAQLFGQVGCTSCHRPTLQTVSKYVPVAHPEVATDPLANIYAWFDLTKSGFKQNAQGGVTVPLFADLKRHNMGPRLAETCELCTEISDAEFTTARLWGVADTAPYLHDGRATTLFQAIEFHGGEAQNARDNFLALAEADQARLIGFLRTLRVPKQPNEELVP